MEQSTLLGSNKKPLKGSPEKADKMKILKKKIERKSNKFVLLHLIVATQLSDGWQHNYSTKTNQAGCNNGQVYVFSYVYDCNSAGIVLTTLHFSL
jgi:hypothetical protein